MATTPAEAFLGQFGVDTTGGSGVTHKFDIMRESIILTEHTINTAGIRGTRSYLQERIRQGNRSVDGQVIMHPTAAELALLLPWILAGSPSGSPTVTYPLGETLQTRFVVVDRVAKVFSYSGCVVDKATFKATQGEALELTLDVVGVDETVLNAGTFPTLTLDIANSPFIFTDLCGAFTLGGTVYTIKDIELVIDNHVDKERYFNCQTRASLPAQDRTVMLNFTNPYGDATALYGSGLLSTHAVATFTNGAAVLIFDMIDFIVPRRSPEMEGRVTEVMIPFNGQCYTSGSTKELITSLNPGP